MEITDMLDDISDYTRDHIFYNNPMTGFFHMGKGVALLFSVFFWGLMVLLPVSHLIKVFLGETTLSIPFLMMFGSIVLLYLVGFIRYRKSKKKCDPR